MGTKDAEIFSDRVQALATKIQESIRSTREGVKYYLPPADGITEKAKSRRHHIIFGRRGSGKSSLLNKVYEDTLSSRQPCAFVDLEQFKGHSYPDVLISVLITTFTEYKSWLSEAAIAPATKKTFWSRFSFEKPDSAKMKKKEANDLNDRITNEINYLNSLLHEPDEADTEHAKSVDLGQSATVSAQAKTHAPGIGEAGVNAEASESSNVSESQLVRYSSKKIEKLHRKIIDFRQLFRDISDRAKAPAYLLLDDLYHIRYDDQAIMIDYFHKIVKGVNVWLKIGTIRHRSNWYIHGTPPIGVKLGDDVDQIDLDLTLEKYQTTKLFLFKILEKFCEECEVTMLDILADGARDRLVLASGGVARDFLTLFNKALEEAKERVLQGKDARGPKIGAEDVNRAAGGYYDYKKEELRRDSADESVSETEALIDRVRKFCIEGTKANCFLLEKDLKTKDANEISELVDLKFVHHVRSRVTVRNREGKIFDAFMLDLSFYAGDRARRGMELVEFWRPGGEDQLRKAGYIYKEA